MTISATLTATGEPLEAFPWTFEKGLESPPVGVTLTNEGPGPASPVVLRIEALSPTAANTWLSYGVPILDEQWIRGAVAGFDDSAVVGGAAWVVQTTEPRGLGSGAGFVIPEWPEGGVIFINLTAKPPGSTFATGGQRIRFGVLANENAIGVPYGLETGIVSGVGRGGYVALVEGYALTYNVAPDPTDELTVAEGVPVLDGAHRWTPETVITLDQLDGDDPPVALAVTEAYRAIGYAHVPDPLDPTTAVVEVVKGLKSGSGVPPAPTPPPGAAIVFDQIVQYDPGGTSILLEGDLIRGPWLDRFHADPDPTNGLSLIIGPGEDVGQGVRRIRPTPTPVSFPANVDGVIVPALSVWLDSAGQLVASTPRPDTNARLLYSDVTTDATDVLTWRDRRTFPKGEVLCQVLEATLDASLVGLEIDTHLTLQDAHVVEVVAKLYRDGLANSGTTTLDVTLDADSEAAYDPSKSIWPTAGTPLSWDFSATGDALTVRTLVELPEIKQGTRLALWLVSLAVGGLPSSCHVCMVGHRPG